MKKKYSASLKDKKDWADFVEQIDNVSVKDEDYLREDHEITKVRKLDLHGYSLNDANKIVKKFIVESYNNNYKKLLIVTGKGLRSKSHDNPYISEYSSILKNSVPVFIRNDEKLNIIVKKMTQADKKDGGDGAINVFLKTNKELIK